MSSRLLADALQALRLIYAEADIIQGEQADRMAIDESHALDPNPLCVLTPHNHLQVVQTIQWALDHNIVIVPSGGRTGLSGGACAGNGEVVLSLGKMDRILDFDIDNGIITVEAGMVLETLQCTVAEQGWFYPVDYASRGSAQMGGAVATNAGGIRVLRYGMTRDQVIGLTAVTGTGQTLSINRHIDKDNAGYDLKNLLIGSEGTLAVITDVTFRLARPMPEQTTLLIGLESLQAMLDIFLQLHKAVTLNAAEFFCANALSQVISRHNLPVPFAGEYAFYLLIELDKSPLTLDMLSGFLVKNDVIVSHSIEQTQMLWRYRELVSSTINPLKPYKNDIACSLSRLHDWFCTLEQEFAAIDPGIQFIWFGHLGDGNVHLNIIRPQTMDDGRFADFLPYFSAIIARVTAQFSASASAEHGIGLLKKDLLQSSRSTNEIAIAQQIRQVFDPQHILNRGKLY